jgi:hypothetical protein
MLLEVAASEGPSEVAQQPWVPRDIPTRPSTGPAGSKEVHLFSPAYYGLR